MNAHWEKLMNMNIPSYTKNSPDILFVIPPFHMRNGGGSFFPLGVGYIIAELKESGYTWDVLNCSELIDSFYDDELIKFSQELAKLLSKYAPSVIGIGPCITTQLRALKIISEVCSQILPNVPVFSGGPLASLKGQEWVFYEVLKIKYLIKGDGELAVVDTIRAIKETGDITNSRCVSHNGYTHVNVIDDINSIPFPYRNFNTKNIISIRRSGNIKNQAAMITSRGCPYACNYCVSGNLSHSDIPYRKRSIDNILDEIQMLNKIYNINDIVFYDDCFFGESSSVNSNVLKYCNALKARDISVSWQVEMRPDAFCNLFDESIQALRDSGCRQINLGIEKCSDKGMVFLGKQNCWSDLKSKINHIKKIGGFSISATFIFGGESETSKDVIEMIKKSQDLQLDFAHYNPLFVYPGTPIYSSLFDDERTWAEIILADDLPWGEIVYENDSLNKLQLLKLIDYAYSEFYKNTELVEQLMVRDRFNLKKG